MTIKNTLRDESFTSAFACHRTEFKLELLIAVRLSKNLPTVQSTRRRRVHSFSRRSRGQRLKTLVLS